ncbi:hypothetical protein [Kingella negevensis]|uniref:hypothetical protein n=1 Tax=Kingella negevensis TaxID=1522312 RepID=UPI00050A2BF2|nr:hypothetical protein [Kingella negevensis]
MWVVGFALWALALDNGFYFFWGVFAVNNGFTVKGKGNGTSDDVEMALPGGSYVLPADSSVALKQGNVPVNVSNGETVLLPEQVHGLGVAVLNQLKEKTHQPVVDKNGLGLGLFFANGGVVQEDKDGVHAGAMRFGGTRAVVKAGADEPFESRTADYMNGIAGEIRQARKEGDFAKELGTSIRGVAGGTGRALGEMYERALNKSVFPAAKAVGEAYDGVRKGLAGFGAGLFGADDKPAENGSVRATAKFAATAAPSASVGQQTTERAQLPYLNGDELAKNQTAVAAVRQRDASNVSSRVNPAADTSSAAPAVGGLNFNGLNMSSKSSPFVASFGSNEAASKEYRELLSKALTPFKGAQNGQLTANQLNLARSLIEGERKNDLAREQQAADLAAKANMQQDNNQVALQREMLQQQAALQREGLNMAAQNGRFNAELAQKQGQFNAQLGFDMRKVAPDLASKERLGLLQDGYLSAKDDGARTEIAKQIAALNGNYKEPAARADTGFNAKQFVKISRDVVGKDGVATQQDDVVDLKTGKSILNREPAAVSAPKAGEVVGGYRFKGGNPNDEKSWEKA